MTRLGIAVEAIIYESTVNGLVELCQSGLDLGLSREQLLYNITALIIHETDLSKAASLVSMAIVLLTEERTDAHV